MKRLRIGILELMYDAPPGASGYHLYRQQLRRQFVSIMPQTLSVWCRQLGHQVYYQVYYGHRDPTELLPRDLDIVMVSAYTQAALVAYAVAKHYRQLRVRTVIGGPHARAFPQDCRRFFDHVVIDCNRDTLIDLLGNVYAPGEIIRGAAPIVQFPSVRERVPELEATSLSGGPAVFRVVPLLSSMGCPYSCDFCSDASNDYRALPATNLAEDLRYVARQYPRAYVVFHDPNFGVRFDQTMQAIEMLTSAERPRFGVQSTLSILKEPRVQRLRDSGCVYLAPGIESWSDYSNKAGALGLTGTAKLEHVIAQFAMMRRYVDAYQANFVFGTDADSGSEPVDLTREFIRRVPYAWPAVAIPTPFGDTELFRVRRSQNRILGTMPFALYYKPYLNFIPLHYSSIEYYEHFVALLQAIVSTRRFFAAVATSMPWRAKAIHAVQRFGVQTDLRRAQGILARLRRDGHLRRYHEGGQPELPQYYHEILRQRLGRYYSWFRPDEFVPHLVDQPATANLSARARVSQVLPASVT
jgi:hypothetical protein